MARPPVENRHWDDIYAKKRETPFRKPLWSLQDLCIENGLNRYKMAGLMHIASAPTAIFKSGRNTFYNPQEFRNWIKTLDNLDKYKEK